MTATLVGLLMRAKQAGLTLAEGPPGTLRVRGNRDAGAVAKALLVRKADVLPLIPFYRGDVCGLDWHKASMAPPDSRCVICNRTGIAVALDPYDGVPMHKGCAENVITHTTDALKLAGQSPETAAT